MEHDMLTEEEKDYIIETAQMDYECGGCTYSDDFYDIMSEILDTDDEEKIAAGIEFYQELAELGPAGMLQEYPELDWSDDYKAEYGELDDDDVEEECHDYVEDGQADINNTADWYKVSQIEGLMYMNKGMTAEEAKAKLGIDPSYVYVPTGNLKHPSFQESSKKNFNTKIKEARMKRPGRKDNMNPGIIVQEASAFLEDKGFNKIEYGTEPKPRTFNIFDKQGETHIIVAINGDYTDDILINAFFDSCCGYGYVIQAQTLDGRIEWAGFDKAEFLEDLEDALVSATEFFETNKDKHTLETWLSQEFEEDEVRDIIEKYHFNGHEDAFMKLLDRDEFEAELAEINKGNFKESKNLRESTADEMDMLEEIKVELENVPEITNVEILTHKINGYDYLKVEGPYDGCPGSNHHVTKLIKSIAEKYGKETDGWGWLYQTERVREWEKENPAPIDPRYARGTSKMFTPSARNPKNKEAKELLANYKKELEEWRRYKKENCPPSSDPGFTVSFAPAGHAASVEAFYNGTRYWGD